MATGTIIVFEEAKKYIIDGGFEAADIIKCAIVDNTVAPTAAFAAPLLTSFTEVSGTGTYTTGGVSLGTLTSMVAEAAGVMTFDSATDLDFAADPSNDVDAFWGILFNDTDAGKRAIAFIELGGPVDMIAGRLQVNWPAGGIYTIT